MDITVLKFQSFAGALFQIISNPLQGFVLSNIESSLALCVIQGAYHMIYFLKN